MRPTVVLLVLATVLMWPLGCPAQTDYSLRIRSLDVTFAGLLDDFLTDVYLNPARVSEVERPIVYAVKMPGRRVECVYPMMEKRGSSVWVESGYDNLTFGINPVGVSVFGSVKGRIGVALGSEIGLSASEHWTENPYVWDQGTSVHIEERGYGGRSDLQHYVVDLAVAPLKDHGTMGIRFKGAYDRIDDVNLRVERDFGWRLADPGNPFESYKSDHGDRCYEKLALSMSAGFFRGDALLRDAVIGASYIDETATERINYLSFLDEDPDGNGVPHPDYSYDSYYGATTVASDRCYTGFGGFLRAHLGWTEHVRSVLSTSWSRSSGDGGSAVRDEYENSTSSTEEDLAYDNDGTVDRIQAECSVGYHEMLFDDVLVAFAAHGYFARTTFDEDGGGELSVYRSAIGVPYTSPYRQRHDDVGDLYRLSIPIGVEWSFHKYAKLRVGAALFAVRTKTARMLTNNAEEIFGSDVDTGGFGFDERYENHDSSVDARFNNGLEININGRFILDLAGSVSTYSMELANFYYLSARFVF